MFGKKDKKSPGTKKKIDIKRRTFLKSSGLFAAGVAAAPHVWIPNEAIAQTSARGMLKHLLYIRLSGGFRFTTAFNGDVADEFNPFGLATNVPTGVEWGPSALLGRDNWVDGANNDMMGAMNQMDPAAMPENIFQPLSGIANDMAVISCADHEPLSGSADGNHITGLERYFTGYVGGGTSIFTMINYGMRNLPIFDEEGNARLPAFVLGSTGMARGTGPYAGYRPPVVSNGGFDDFGFAGSGAVQFVQNDADGDNRLDGAGDWDWPTLLDKRMKDRQHHLLRPQVDAYLQARVATDNFAAIFRDEALKINNGGTDPIDGVSNAEMAAILGDDGAARNLRLALRLFHFGAPAAYLDQGGYDYHSGEETSLPGRLDNLSRLVVGLNYLLKRMTHPDGGTYWDHTLVVLGSEFGRTARGGRFNSARGSDHGGDFATRWMSMPVMGGLVGANGGRIIGANTNRGDLSPEGNVFSYRSVAKTLMDALGCEHEEFFPADEPFSDLWG